MSIVAGVREVVYHNGSWHLVETDHPGASSWFGINKLGAENPGRPSIIDSNMSYTANMQSF